MMSVLQQAPPPPSPSSNRTCGFPASGSHAMIQTEHSQGYESEDPAPVWLSLSASVSARAASAAATPPAPTSVRSTFLPRVLLWVFSYQSGRTPLRLSTHRIEAPSLHGRYPLHRYYGPLRLPSTAPDPVIDSRIRLAGLPAPSRRSGSPKFPTVLSARAVSFHPGESDADL